MECRLPRRTDREEALKSLREILTNSAPQGRLIVAQDAVLGKIKKKNQFRRNG